MQYEIKTVGKNAIQITTTDERWYAKTDEKTKETIYVPSVSWIASFYPKGIGFMKWLASKGWDEAEAIKEEAGEKGSRVHHAIELLIAQGSLKHNDLFPDSKGEAKELSGEEYGAVVSFSNWFKINKPKIIQTEFAVFGDFYGGTVDILCEIDGVKWIVDIKTSQYVWATSELQVSAYKYAVPDVQKIAILQVGYKRNKNNYKFTEIDDQYELFKNVYKIWEKEVSQKQPLQKNLPLEISIK